ncbi:hypothetical protein IscW_ISCW021874, partial [Ixodes scapularis]
EQGAQSQSPSSSSSQPGRPSSKGLALKSCGGINDLSELVSPHYNIQEARLRTTPAGRSILAKLGYAVHDLPELPQQTPPWEHIVLTDGTPLPQRIQSTGRRLPLKRRHL